MSVQNNHNTTAHLNSDHDDIVNVKNIIIKREDLFVHKCTLPSIRLCQKISLIDTLENFLVPSHIIKYKISEQTEGRQ